MQSDSRDVVCLICVLRIPKRGFLNQFDSIENSECFKSNNGIERIKNIYSMWSILVDIKVEHLNQSNMSNITLTDWVFFYCHYQYFVPMRLVSN